MPSLYQRFNHLQNATASFQLTQTTGWSFPWANPGLRQFKFGSNANPSPVKRCAPPPVSASLR